jgi:hypothetical protein
MNCSSLVDDAFANALELAAITLVVITVGMQSAGMAGLIGRSGRPSPALLSLT